MKNRSISFGCRFDIFYGIVSKGIHELSEEDCIEYFPVMQSFIMMILGQWEKKRMDEEEEREIAISLSNIYFSGTILSASSVINIIPIKYTVALIKAFISRISLFSCFRI